MNSYAAAVTGVPAISLADSFLPFQPGMFQYSLDRGYASNAVTYASFGVTTLAVFPPHDILPHDDAPDLKMRVRLTLDGPPPSIPQGSITVRGNVYERVWTNPTSPPFVQNVADTITFVTDGTYTTSEYFDEITSIETSGLNVDVTMRVEWWDGHEQEMSVGARLDIPTSAVTSLATSLGYADLTAALAPLGSRFGIRFHQQAAPYTAVIDMSGGLPTRLVYVVPNIVVELISIAGDDSETVVATVLVDVVDRDHEVSFSTGGTPALTARWGQREILSMTTTYLAGCDGALAGTSCNTHLLAVMGALWWPRVDDKLLDMIEQAPGLHRFDAGQEAPLPRHLTNVRTFLQGEGVVLVGDLCRPGSVGCT